MKQFRAIHNNTHVDPSISNSKKLVKVLKLFPVNLEYKFCLVMLFVSYVQYVLYTEKDL